MYRVLTNIAKRLFTDAQIYKYGFNWSPMYRRSTGKVIEVSDDLHFVKIKIPLNWKNRNFVGTIFGGSMLSATDPIYMIQLMNILGEDYIGKPFTGDDLPPEVIYTTRSHEWSTTKIKDLITKQTIKQNPDIVKEV